MTISRNELLWILFIVALGFGWGMMAAVLHIPTIITFLVGVLLGILAGVLRAAFGRYNDRGGYA